MLSPFFPKTFLNPQTTTFLFQAINNGDNLVYMYDNFSNFKITHDQIIVVEPYTEPLSPYYSFDTIKYISTWLFIYLKDGVATIGLGISIR